MFRKFAHIGPGFAAGIFSFFILTAAVPAQVAPVPDEEFRSQLDKSKIRLDEKSQELADEYLDLLDDLSEIIEDYRDYLNEIDENNHCDDINFRVLNKGLAKGIYAEDFERLHTDLTAYIKELKAKQDEYDNRDDRQSRKCYRLIKSLSRELAITNDLLENNISGRYAEEMISKEVQLYLKEALQEVQQLKLGELFQKLAKGLENIDDIEKLKELNDLDSFNFNFQDWYVKNDSEKIKIITQTPPVPPIPPVKPVKPAKGANPFAYSYTYSDDDEAGLGREITSIMTVSSSCIPIYVTNPMGNIDITGTDDDDIEVSLNVRISADSRQLEKKFVEETHLQIKSQDDGYYVVADLPKFNNSYSRTIQSSLTVTLPRDNHVICNDKYGKISIADLANGLQVKGVNAKVTALDIEGDVTIETSMDTVTVSDISGRLKIINSYAPVSVADCEGDMTIENAYALVEIMDSQGDLNINNSGITEIRDHEGDVHISNIYGKVFVTGLEGNLTARNAYSPIEIMDIDGNVELENNYSTIEVNRIEGWTKAKNMFGNIKAEELYGPVDFTNEHGNILFMISDDLKGPSFITSTGGLIRLAIPSETDLLISAQTTNNEIRSFFPIDLTREGNLIEGKIIFGQGDNSLTLKGANTPIIISEN